MKRIFMAIDDQKTALEGLADALAEAEPGSDVRTFAKQEEGIRQIREEGLRPDAVFLDIDMPGMPGLEAAKRIRELSGKTRIIFVTGYSEYALDAFAMHASGYLMKPVSAAKIRKELDAVLGLPVLVRRRSRIRVQCFGSFEVFAEDAILYFHLAKSKELFAYLIDRRGALVTMPQLMDVLWEDGCSTEARGSYLRNLVTDVRRTLKGAGADDVFVKVRNGCAVDTAKIDCDYYDFLNGSTDAVNLYSGEYMSQYSWGEMTLASLVRGQA